MSEVWVSIAPISVSHMWGFKSSFYETHESVALQAIRDSAKGLSLNGDVFPKSVYADLPRVQPAKISNIPPLFFNGLLFADDSVRAAVISGNAGNCEFFPVETFANDRVTPLKSRYHVMNIGNTKSCFVATASIGIKANRFIKPPVYHTHNLIKDDDVAVDGSASDGVEIWIDPILDSAFFVSGGIAQQLVSAGLVDGLKLRKCRQI